MFSFFFIKVLSIIFYAAKFRRTLQNLVHFRSVLYVRLVVNYSRVEYVVQAMLSQVLQRYHSEHIVELVSLRQPKLFELSDSVDFTLESLENFLKLFFLDTETAKNSADKNPMFLDESEQRFGKVFYHIFGLWNLKDFVFGLIRLFLLFFFWHFRFE